MLTRMVRNWGRHGCAAAGETLALLLLSPLVIGFSTRTPAWDELFFFHHAACLRNAVQELSWPLADSCMKAMTKSPILALMLLPSTPLHGVESLAVAPVMLALLNFALLWLALRLAQRGGMPLPATIAAAAVAILAAPLATGGPFLSDGLAAIVTLDTLLLLPLESGKPTESAGAAVRRGVLWGVLLSIGVLTKLTYLYFAGASFALALLLSLRHAGARGTAWKLAAMAVVCAVPAAVFARYGWIYWNWAMNAAFGPLTAFYDDHLQRWQFLSMAFGSVGRTYWLGLAILLAFALLARLRDGQRRAALPAVGVLVIAAGYLFIASGSPNKDPRFFWPVWLALPFGVGLLGARLPPIGPARVGSIGLAPLALAVLLSVATSGRFNFRAVSEADLIFRSLPHEQPIRVMLASDEADFNIETFILARQLDFAAYRRIDVGTVVYDIVSGKTPEESIKRLTDAHYVVLRDPVDGSAPEWANRYLPRFAAAVAAKGRLVRTFAGREATRVFAMH